jgi:hypothetical protein
LKFKPSLYVLRPVMENGRQVRRQRACGSSDGLPQKILEGGVENAGVTAPSMPPRLLHPRAGLRQFFEPAVDLRAGHGEILELAVVEPVHGQARGVALVARDHRCEEAVGETAPACEPNGGSPGQWPGGGGRNGGHGCVLQ